MNSNHLKTWAKDQPSPYEIKDITHFPDWGRLIVLDAFFNNLTSGFMLAATIVWIFGPLAFADVMPVVMTAALIILGIDLCLLIADLGSPSRFIHALRVMRFTSPLSVGVWALVSYGAFLSVAVLLGWVYFAFLALGGSGLGMYLLGNVLDLCIVMAAMAAVIVISYKGVVFSCSSQPGLCQARWLTPFMVSDSLLMGMGLVAIIVALIYRADEASIMLILPIIVLLSARCIAFGLLWQDVKTRARKVYTKAHNRATVIIVYVAGAVLPLLLLFIGRIGVMAAALLFLWAGYTARSWLIGLPRPINNV